MTYLMLTITGEEDRVILIFLMRKLRPGMVEQFVQTHLVKWRSQS